MTQLSISLGLAEKGDYRGQEGSGFEFQPTKFEGQIVQHLKAVCRVGKMR